MKQKTPYLKKLKQEDPEKLKETREKALDIRRANSSKMQNIKDLIKGELSICVNFRDKKTGQLIKDKKGRLVEITKKELLVINTIDKVVSNPTVRDLREIGEIIGDIDKRNENNVNVIFESLRNELMEDNK